MIPSYLIQFGSKGKSLASIPIWYQSKARDVCGRDSAFPMISCKKSYDFLTEGTNKAPPKRGFAGKTTDYTLWETAKALRMACWIVAGFLQSPTMAKRSALP